VPRRATGQVIERDGADGRTYRSLRFRAYGERRFISLGPDVSRGEAERLLRGILADIERGIWQPDEPAQAPAPLPGAQTFHEFAELWWLDHVNDWKPRTVADYRWRLENHLLPFFGQHRLDEITIAEVDRYRALKRKPGADGRQLSPRTVNMTLVLLSAILEVAEERDLIPRNNARGKRRRVRRAKTTRTYLDTAEQIAALLQAARAVDEKGLSAGDVAAIRASSRSNVALAREYGVSDSLVARIRLGRKHARDRRTRLPAVRFVAIAILIFAGLRVSELVALRWRDVDLANGRLRVEDSKTEAGIREVTIRPFLRDVLLAFKASTRASAKAYVLASIDGQPLTEENVRKGILQPSRRRANEDLSADACELPSLTPHSLRRTFASLLYAIGEPPPVVMAEMGHTDPALALAIYARAMRRGPRERAKLTALVNGEPIPSAQTAQTPAKTLEYPANDDLSAMRAKAA